MKLIYSSSKKVLIENIFKICANKKYKMPPNLSDFEKVSIFNSLALLHVCINKRHSKDSLSIRDIEHKLRFFMSFTKSINYEQDRRKLNSLTQHELTGILNTLEVVLT